MSIQIDHDKPIPADRRSKYPWEQMAVGDSFFAPKKPQYLFSSCKNKSRGGRRYIVRTVEGGCRVWRVE
jgi:hypothetical protein